MTGVGGPGFQRVAKSRSIELFAACRVDRKHPGKKARLTHSSESPAEIPRTCLWPEGPSTQYSRFLILTIVNSMVSGARASNMGY